MFGVCRVCVCRVWRVYVLCSRVCDVMRLTRIKRALGKRNASYCIIRFTLDYVDVSRCTISNDIIAQLTQSCRQTVQ